MKLWENEDWTTYIDFSYEWHRTGLKFRFAKGIDIEVKRACIDFSKWLRQNYEFPIRIPIYFKDTEYITSLSGEKVSATFFGPYDKRLEPYIKVSAGDYHKMEIERGRDNALAAILNSIAHELSHYFQWIQDFDYLEKKQEKQAKYYSSKIIQKYAETREHP